MPSKLLQNYLKSFPTGREAFLFIYGCDQQLYVMFQSEKFITIFAHQNNNMKKITTRFLFFLLIVSIAASSASAATVPVSATAPTLATVPTPATEPVAPKAEPSPETVKSAMDELKNLSKHEKKSRLKEVKKALKEYRAKKKAHMDEDAELILLVILAILLPQLAVYLKEGEFNVKFWISLALLLLVFLGLAWWLVGALFAVLVVLDVI
jgi:uncharacterized membrane protein YqaE (UPF0057 family)